MTKPLWTTSDETVEITPSQVREHKRMFYSCMCGKRHYLGPWGAAHLGNTVFETRCSCGRLLVFVREGDATDD